jgi:hypothetical protein
MTRSRISTLMAVLVVGLAIAGAGAAQVRTKEKVGFAVTGEITAIDVAAKSLTVKSTNDEGVVYAVNDTTNIMSGSKKLAFGDLKKGWHVVMNGQDAGATKVVTYLKVVKAP